MLRVGYPTLLAWRGGTIYPGSSPAGVTTRSPRMVTECFLTGSMLIKMYFPLHGLCLYMYFPFTVSQFHADAHSVYLVCRSGVDFTKGFKTWHKFSTEIRFMLIPIIVLFIAHEVITGNF